MGSLGTIGGGAPAGGASAPGLTVTDRTDGEAYTVTAGARSLSITNPDSATLSTTVEKASDGSAVSVTGPATTTPSWIAPSGSDVGEAVQVRVSATKDGLTTTVQFTERVAGTGESDPVTAPGTTTEAVAAGGSFGAKTFGSFTDPDARIDNYLATTTNSAGSTAWSGSGLGPYTASGSADGDAGVLTLTARDSSNNHLATAVHEYSRAEDVPAVETVLDVDWAQLWIDNGSTNVDLSSSGTYTLGGTSFTVDENHSGVTATLKSTGLHIVQVSGSNFDWSISLTANKASVVQDYTVITADISATISSRTSGTNGNGLYAAGYTQNPSWGTSPGNNTIGGGIYVQNNSTNNRTTVVRNVSAQGATNSISKTNPSTFHNRWYAVGQDYMGANHTSAFGSTNLIESSALKMNSTYSLSNTGYPTQHNYRTNAYPIVWTTGNGNLDLDLLVTRTTWLAWPTDG